MTNIDHDKQSRDKIRNDIHTSFFVEAGAGSGKTSVLVDRMVAMVEGGIDISRICAITFTKAAAGEFYARFQKKLSESDSPIAKEALQNIDLCFMGTLDSFCNMILSEHPSEAGIPSDSAVRSREYMLTQYRNKFALIRSGGLGMELNAKCSRFIKCFRDPEGMFCNIAEMISANRNAAFNYLPLPADDPDKAFGESRKSLIQVLDTLRKHPEMQFSGKSSDSAQAWDALLNDSDAIFGSWDDEPYSVLNALKGLTKLRLDKSCDIALLGPGYEHFFAEHMTRNKLCWYELDSDESADPLMIKALNSFRFSAAMDLAVSSMDIISGELQQKGDLTFTDYLIILRDLLRDDAAADGLLIRHIYERHSYFLIDEFQDTNPIQAEIFFYLTAQDPCDDWTKCVPKPGSIFIVGDPKQSIYRFRNADVASFIRVRGLFSNNSVGDVLHLSRNFRSSDNMCGWFNEVFTELLPSDTEIQSKFEAIPLGEKQSYGASLKGAYNYCYEKARKKIDDPDPSRVAEIISRIVNDPELTIQDRDNNGTASAPRNATYSDFMLITPTKSHLRYYMNALTDACIPFRIEGNVLFGECPALISISHMMSAVADPFNKRNTFAATYLSGCSMIEEEIFEFSRRAKNMSPASVFTMLLEEKRVFARVGADNAEYLYYALELLRSGESDGSITSVKDGAAYLNSLVTDGSDKERCIQLVRDGNRVHLANLHKVKGLEAPIVILADPARKDFPPDHRLDYSTMPPQAWIFSIGNLNDTSYPDELTLENEVLESEKTRLLYVAATRAGNALIISDPLNSKGDRIGNNPWAPLLERVEHDIFAELGNPAPPARTAETANADDLYDRAAADSVANAHSPKAPSYRIDRPSSPDLKSKTSSESEYDDGGSVKAETAGETAETEAAIAIPAISASTGRRQYRDSALMGTLIHRMMEILVSSRNSICIDSLTMQISGEFDVDDEAYTDTLRRACKIIKTGGYDQEHGTPKDILNELLSADEVHCELPFCHSECDVNNESRLCICNGVIDVAYCKNDAWHIIDYKTNLEAKDLDEHYRKQLDAYINAFRKMTGEKADARIYHIDLQK